MTSHSNIWCCCECPSISQSGRDRSRYYSDSRRHHRKQNGSDAYTQTPQNVYGSGPTMKLPYSQAGFTRQRNKPSYNNTSPILFYEMDKPYFEFTNFSWHSIEYKGLVYPTSEHLFQAHKFLGLRPDLAESIRIQGSPRDALEQARRLRKYQRPDWYQENIRFMEEVLYLKFTQHPELISLLKSTGKRELIEDSPVDDFWGVGSNGLGRNELGKALMRLRKQL